MRIQTANAPTCIPKPYKIVGYDSYIPLRVPLRVTIRATMRVTIMVTCIPKPYKTVGYDPLIRGSNP